ncbi:hypothetical protein [Candidatus Competibacter phosphatis]|uniref:hypothetical protein n=1 Tax=Candidatus Competibacter phosphatis TaxID=221280 RepID=UPI001FE51D7A|nr:hypothetical protein [Candidatus Competibacter phosphatis]
MRKQLTGMPGILGGDAPHFPQDAQGTRADILQIADGGGDHIQRAGFDGHAASPSGSANAGHALNSHITCPSRFIRNFIAVMPMASIMPPIAAALRLNHWKCPCILQFSGRHPSREFARPAFPRHR